jgi:hypothetical protein
VCYLDLHPILAENSERVESLEADKDGVIDRLRARKPSGDLAEVLDIGALSDPFKTSVIGRIRAGVELQEPVVFDKGGLVFPVDEPLPRYRLEAHCRDELL